MEIKYSVMFGLNVPKDSNMPEKLREKLNKALKKKSETIQDYLDGIVESYMDSEGLENSYRIERKITEVKDEDDFKDFPKKSKKKDTSFDFVKDVSKSMDDLEKKLFSKLDKKGSEEDSEKTSYFKREDESPEKFKETVSGDINKLISELVLSKDDLERSIIAYKVLNLRVKAYKEKISERMDKVTSNKFEMLKTQLGVISQSDNNSEADKKAEDSYKELINIYECNTAGIISQLNKLHVLSLTEYEKQDLDSRYNYVVKCCQDLTEINTKIDNIFNKDPKATILNSMYEHYDIDKFTKTILFNK